MYTSLSWQIKLFLSRSKRPKWKMKSCVNSRLFWLTRQSSEVSSINIHSLESVRNPISRLFVYVQKIKSEELLHIYPAKCHPTSDGKQQTKRAGARANRKSYSARSTRSRDSSCFCGYFCLSPSTRVWSIAKIVHASRWECTTRGRLAKGEASKLLARRGVA